MDRKRPRGITPKGDRIELCFSYQGKRYRPTLDWAPTQTNLKNAKRRLLEIRRRIHDGTFSFRDEFPDYKWVDKVAPRADTSTFDQVADEYLDSIAGEKQYATRESYRKILKSFWRPLLGKRSIDTITFRDLRRAITSHPWKTPKTRNNVVSVVRLVFQFAVHDGLIAADPSQHLKSLKVQREPPDPYTIDEALALIAGMRKHRGAHLANYFEFCFFAGPRPSEVIALLWTDVDLVSGKVSISKARVMARNKNTVKNYKPRIIELNQRALAVLKRQAALTRLAGGHVFTREDGNPIHDLQVPWKAWVYVHKKLGLRYREPYQTRHSSVSWNLMIGKNLMWLAKQHGHSPTVMLNVYGSWMDGCDEKTLAKIRREIDSALNAARRGHATSNTISPAD